MLAYCSKGEQQQNVRVVLTISKLGCVVVPVAICLDCIIAGVVAVVVARTEEGRVRKPPLSNNTRSLEHPNPRLVIIDPIFLDCRIWPPPARVTRPIVVVANIRNYQSGREGGWVGGFFCCKDCLKWV